MLSSLPSSRRSRAGAPLIWVGSVDTTPGNRGRPPAISRATLSAPTIGRTTALTTPPPSASSTTSGASRSSSPCRSPVSTARANAASASRLCVEDTGPRGLRAATWALARCAIWRTAAGLLSTAAAISS